MAAPPRTPREIDRDSRNERFKSRSRSILWSSMIVATVAHFAAFAFWPELVSEDFSFTSEEITAIELPPEIEVPPPPQAITRPAVPVIATADVDEDITIAPTTFEDNPVESLPPPPDMADSDLDIAANPTFTPFTVAPDILNRDEVVRAMARTYPQMLRDAGVGGIVRVFFFIDAEGVVRDTRIDRSSGYDLLDDAALQVAGIYRFSPALNRDTRVPVWVSFPIEFRVIR